MKSEKRKQADLTVIIVIMKKKIIAELILAALIIIVLGFMLFHYTAKKAEKVTENTQELRLEKFTQWMKEDPLLFDPYMNQLQYSEAATRYISSMQIFLNAIQGEKISPTNFMEKFGVASLQYQKFQENVSEDNAKALLAAIGDAQKAYEDDAAQIIKSFESLKEIPQSDKKIAFLGGETTTDIAIIINDLKMIQKNGEALKREIAGREKCLTQSVEFCKKPSDSFLQPQEIAPENEVPETLSKEELEIPADAIVRGPYRVNSSCWNKRDYQWLYSWQYCEDKTYCGYRAYLSDNRYFNTVGQLLLEKNIVDDAVKLKPMGVSAPYTCNNLEYKNVVEAMDYFIRTYAHGTNGGFLNSFSFDGDGEFMRIISKGQVAEKAFFEANYPSQNSLEYLGNYYLYAYGYAVRNQLLENDQRQELLRLGILIQEKMVNMPDVLNNLSMFIERLNEVILKTGARPPLLYLYVTKSSYSELFYSFSPAVWRLEEKLHFLDIGASSENNFKMNDLKIMDFKAAKLEYGEEALLNWINIFEDLKQKDS